MELFCWAIQIYMIICVVRVIMSFIPNAGESVLTTIASISYSLTEPLFAAVRRALPQIGDLPIDFSPMVVLLGLGLLRQLFCGLA